MLFIQKTQPNQELIDFVNAEKAKLFADNKDNHYPKYSALQSDKSYKLLRQQLYEEQRGLCCYCMQKITIDSSSIEHFLPESIFPQNEVDYFNLFLACRYSDGLSGKERKQYCDKAKGNILISKHINYLHYDSSKNKTTKCEDLVKYNELGYILPNRTDLKTLNSYYQNYEILLPEEKVILGSIEVLNLNCESLVNKRHKFIVSEGFTKKELEKISDPAFLKQKIEKIEVVYPQFAGVSLYFLNERLRQLP